MILEGQVDHVLGLNRVGTHVLSFVKLPWRLRLP